MKVLQMVLTVEPVIETVFEFAVKVYLADCGSLETELPEVVGNGDLFFT